MRKQVRYIPVLLVAAPLAFTKYSNAQNSSPYWSLAGNSNATSTSKLGTTNGVSLRLYTNNIQRMIVSYSTGHVGIGTTNPTDRLHINSASGTNAFRAQINGNTKLLVHSNGGVAIGANQTPPTNGLYVSGNTGIGTTSPISKLHVVGSSTAITASGGTVGLYAVTDGYEDNDVGVQGQGYGYGVIGSGYYYGVYAAGLTGVYGRGENYGFYGESYSTGVYGRAGLGYGLYGTASTGVYGYGDDFGADFTGYSDAGVRATTTYGTYAGAFYGPVYASGGFVTSDKKFKNNIQDVEGALSLIHKLKPQRYDFVTDEKYAFLNLPKGAHYGLLAQDVEAVLPNLVSTANHEVRKPAAPPQPFKLSDKGAPARPAALQPVPKEQRETVSIKAVNYIELIPILIKGMQEQQQQIEELKNLVHQLTQERGSNVVTTMGMLGQATPNPARTTTRIAYTLPAGTAQAQVQVFDGNGKLLKAVPLSTSGTLDLNTAALSSGVYNYSLVVNGKIVETKKLTVIR